MQTNERDNQLAANNVPSPQQQGGQPIPQNPAVNGSGDNGNRQQQAEQPGTQQQQGASRSGSTRGFAGMDEARQRAIAAEGGRAAHQKGTAHEFTSEEAREAGRKGGEARALNARNAALNASRTQPQ